MNIPKNPSRTSPSARLKNDIASPSNTASFTTIPNMRTARSANGISFQTVPLPILSG